MQSFEIQTEKSNLELLIESNNFNLDWDQVAREVQSRSALECQSEWFFHKYPLLNFKPFTQQELEKLEKLVEKYKASNWNLIARDLGVRLSFLKYIRIVEYHGMFIKLMY